MIDKFIDPVAKILDKFVADKDLKEKLQHELLMSIQDANLAQIKVNQQEAAHKSIFSCWLEAIYWLGVWRFFGLSLNISTSY